MKKWISIILVAVMIIASVGGTMYWLSSTPTKVSPKKIVGYNVYYNDQVYDIHFTVNNSQYKSLENGGVSNPTQTYLLLYVDNHYNSSFFPVYNASVSLNGNSIYAPLSQDILTEAFLWLSLQNIFTLTNKSQFDSAYPAFYSGYQNRYSQWAEGALINIANSLTFVLSAVNDLVGYISGSNAQEIQSEVKNLVMLVFDILEGSQQVSQQFGSTNASGIASTLYQSGVLKSPTVYGSLTVASGLDSMSRTNFSSMLNSLYITAFGSKPNSETIDIASIFLDNLIKDIPSTGLDSFLTISGLLFEDSTLQLALEATSWEVLGGFFEFSVPIALASAIATYFAEKLLPDEQYLNEERSIEHEVFSVLLNAITTEESHMTHYVRFWIFSNIPDITDTANLFYNYSQEMSLTQLWYRVNAEYMIYNNGNNSAINGNMTTANNAHSILEKMNGAMVNATLASKDKLKVG